MLISFLFESISTITNFIRYLSEVENFPMKLYIMASILLYHCCVNSQGAVHEDICKNFNKQEQELILMFCEKLGDMETTLNNIELAIKGRYMKSCFLSASLGIWHLLSLPLKVMMYPWLCWVIKAIRQSLNQSISTVGF